jgi:two-component system nitrate/nitrite sensor histidine kinase NarX
MSVSAVHSSIHTPAQVAQRRDFINMSKALLESMIQVCGAQAGWIGVLSSDGSRYGLWGDHNGSDSALSAPELANWFWQASDLIGQLEDLVWLEESKAFGQLMPQFLATVQQHYARMLGVPLSCCNHPLVGFCILFFEQPVSLSEEMFDLIGRVGQMLGLSLHNARQEREQLLNVVMDERKAMASEVHDSMAQMLVYANMRLSMLKDALAEDSAWQAEHYCDDVEEALTTMNASLRELMTNFRTRMSSQGLVQDLQDMCRNFIQRTGLTLHFDCAGDVMNLSLEQELQIFHIVQEALSNVYRHAKAQVVWVNVHRNDQRLEVMVRDDGKGISSLSDQSLAQGHWGLDIMSERAQRVGGELTVHPHHEGGTQVRLVVPFKQIEREELV